eukprot:TRINITY_DN14473_c0_g1_i1.p1 TRINITY_DN14473_c0_g1~~TRINITY_DN14473_c0_g1_i1.p1  ORF type:complete len:221 (-),score=22.61 TRINITY_DN14473_c0_g1_i1:16-678(-)
MLNANKLHPAVSRGSISLEQKHGCNTTVKTIVFNKVALDIPAEVAAQQLVNSGLIVNIHCKQLSHYIRFWNGNTFVRKPVFRPICKTAMITITYEEAAMLIQVLTLRKHYLTLDLKDTELFQAPDLWQQLGLDNKSHKKLFLVLTDASSPKFEKKERAINKRKRDLKISGVTLTWFCLFPISIPLLVAGHKTSTCSKFHHTWHDIFNASTLDVTPVRLAY